MPQQIPQEFLCPISMELMEDPVLCADGHTYDRVQITEWLKRSPTSPMTRQPLNGTMHPNYALKASIQRWKADHSTTPPLPTAPLAPSYPSYTVPYTPPQLYPIQSSYQQYPQSAQMQMSIVPNYAYTYAVPPAPRIVVPPSQLQQSQQSQQNPLTPAQTLRNNRVLVFVCVLFLILSILAAILSASRTRNSNASNNDDDN